MILDSFKNALMISSFVFVMMLLVEYVNIQSRGGWSRVFQMSRWRQYIFAAFLGAIPGCLGAFAATTLYSHNIISFGALVATMVTTSGDEAFIMFALMPRTALLITLVLFGSSLLLAVLVDRFTRAGAFASKDHFHSLPIHDTSNCLCFDPGKIITQLHHLSFQRFLLISLILILLTLIGTGIIGPQTWDWMRITFTAGLSLTLFVALTVPEHFLKEHVWEHLLKAHLPRIFLWTFGTLLVLNIARDYLAVENLIEKNYLAVLLIAVIVGLIPQSGPHFAFIALFLEGSLPLSILLANSASQDGHGTLPLIAFSKRSFIVLKLINLVWGLILGLSFHLFDR